MSDLPPATANKSAGSRPRAKRKLGNFLLNKEVQLRYVMFVTVVALLISAALGYMIYSQNQLATSTLVELSGGTFGDDSEMQSWIGDQLSNDDRSLVLEMFAFGLGLAFILSLFMTVMTHKVAGPLHKVSGYFDKMSQGKLGEVYNLRRFDMLKDFYQEFRHTHTMLRARHRQTAKLLSDVRKACEKAGVSDEAMKGTLAKIEAFAKDREDRLR